MFLHKNIIPRIFLRGKKAYSYLDIHFFQFNLHFYIKIIVFYINKMTLCAVMALVTWWVVKALVFLHSDVFFPHLRASQGSWYESSLQPREKPHLLKVIGMTQWQHKGKRSKWSTQEYYSLPFPNLLVERSPHPRDA